MDVNTMHNSYKQILFQWKIVNTNNVFFAEMKKTIFITLLIVHF